MQKITFLLCCLFFLSCNEEIKTNIIKGKLKESCEGAVLGNTEMVLVNSGNQKIIATTTTGPLGLFSLSYELEEDIEGLAEMKYFNGESFKKVMTSIPLNTSVDLLLLDKNTSQLAVEVQNNGNSSQDTLFYSVTGSNWKKKFISPENGAADTILFSLPKEYNNSSNRYLYWGLGEADYQKAKNSVDSKNPYHHIPFVLNTCEISQITIEL